MSEYEKGYEQCRKDILKKLKPCIDYCIEVNGMDRCKNCGLSLKEL
jgi:hypothetical protein